MEDEEDVLALVVIASAIKSKRKVKKRRKRREWTKQWLLRRQSRGLYNNLIQELRLEEELLYSNYLRMSRDNFDTLLSLVKVDISKETTNMREPISPEVKLVITIRFLATGSSYTDLACQYRVHKSTISKFIPEVCDTIYLRLHEEYLKVLLFYFLSFIYLFVYKNITLKIFTINLMEVKQSDLFDTMGSE
jgi:hypothetical protein